jgi:hypothetical protein
MPRIPGHFSGTAAEIDPGGLQCGTKWTFTKSCAFGAHRA